IPRTSSRSSLPPVRVLPHPTLRVRGSCLKDTHGWRLPYALLRCSTPVLCPGDATEGHKASDRGYAHFRVLRYGEVRRIRLPRSRVNKEGSGVEPQLALTDLVLI